MAMDSFSDSVRLYSFHIHLYNKVCGFYTQKLENPCKILTQINICRYNNGPPVILSLKLHSKNGEYKIHFMGGINVQINAFSDRLFPTI